jgi:hypothetical protein
MPAQDQRFDMRLGSPNWFKTIAEGLEEQRRGMTDDRGRNPIKKNGRRQDQDRQTRQPMTDDAESDCG